ncbi:hypothetical protein BJ508DRAFT_413242 [Ascobolus immersus RN42]|uniref:GYF domain-containing protein n=1 Tax=Ascobolus immersus RN42 TaxID=1160509 RepID=A0A3N4IH87_ASCIM|nr:hypothetical protein BJ508DRAFT_413242 [Ascobolus immersus RN42]
MSDRLKPQFDPRNPSALLPENNPNASTKDDEDPDSVLDLDEIGIGARKTKRGAVNIAGYDTDSSGDEGGKVGMEPIAEDDDDMFGDSDSEDKKKKAGEASDKKKNVRFLRKDEIEGQEEDTGDVYSDAESEDEAGTGEGTGVNVVPDDVEPSDPESMEEDGEGHVPKKQKTKKKAPKIEPFHMSNEMEEGAFDETGNYVRNARDAEELHDNWLAGVKKADIAKAKAAHEAREKIRIDKEKSEKAIPTYEILAVLITSLERGETVIEALGRVGSGMKRKRTQVNWREKRKAKKAGVEDAPPKDAEMTEAPPETEEEKADRLKKELVEKITEAADRLLTRGQTEIYDKTREELQRQYRALTGDDWVDTSTAGPGQEQENFENAQWEYRWTDNRDSGAVYGPFGTAEMRAWYTHGFFEGPIEFRRAGSGDGNWSGVAAFVE